jgi:hypothetical protein
MSNFGRSAFYGGIYAKDQHQNWETCQNCDIKESCRFHKTVLQIERMKEYAEKGWEKTRELSIYIKDNLSKHIWEKQDIYLPVLIATIILALVFVSKTAFSATVEQGNNLPIEDSYKVKLIGTDFQNKEGAVCDPQNQDYKKVLAKAESGEESSDLKEDVEKIVKNTPMAAMAEAISHKPRPVAAFIVGIAMKESKFGVYSPKKGGRDCYNYWGFKGGGTTVSGGYSCFSSPEQAIDAVGGKIEKMVAKGIRTPAQAIGWKCGSSCAGHDPSGVSKWISDVAINFYKINS